MFLIAVVPLQLHGSWINFLAMRLPGLYARVAGRSGARSRSRYGHLFSVFLRPEKAASHNFTMAIHWNILDEKRRGILPFLKGVTGGDFYLAGGTGLALQLGHRDSVDFDFFIAKDYDTSVFVAKIEETFKNHNIKLTQREANTLSYTIDDTISISLFGHNHAPIQPLVETEYFPLASIADIGCMKFTAITARSVEKDYVDLYFILQQASLRDLLAFCVQKYPTLDAAVILKSLVYFDDILHEPIIFKEGHEVPFAKIKAFLQEKVTDYFKND